jgi:N-hydroxyarylamine O-acetyltransferase
MESALLDQYFARIAYAGPREPSLAVLHTVTGAHAEHIPFENLDVLLGRAIDLSDDAVFDKLVLRKRGGYCFEQNALLMRVLCALGFEVKPLSARGRIFWPDRSFIPPRTHLLLQVTLDGASWLTDVGVGASSLTAAIRFELDVEQHTPHDLRRIIRENDRFYHQVRHGAAWVDVYEFTGEEMPSIDRVVANWYTSAHPQSHFKSRMIVARAGREGRRYSLVDRELKQRERDGHASSRLIGTPEQLLEVLASEFGLVLTPGERLPWTWSRASPTDTEITQR